MRKFLPVLYENDPTRIIGFCRVPEEGNNPRLRIVNKDKIDFTKMYFTLSGKENGHNEFIITHIAMHQK